MPLVLIKEDGTGKADANSYASAADGDAYHEGHLYASAWTGASATNKEKALVLATRLIDACCQFSGVRASTTQALQWPRAYAVDPDRNGGRVSLLVGNASAYFESDKVPRAVVDATCEMARESLTRDRTDAPDGEGLSHFSLSGALSMTFDAKDRAPILSHLAQAMLGKLGSFIGAGQGVARLVRT